MKKKFCSFIVITFFLLSSCGGLLGGFDFIEIYVYKDSVSNENQLSIAELEKLRLSPSGDIYPKDFTLNNEKGYFGISNYIGSTRSKSKMDKMTEEKRAEFSFSIHDPNGIYNDYELMSRDYSNNKYIETSYGIRYNVVLTKKQ